MTSTEKGNCSQKLGAHVNDSGTGLLRDITAWFSRSVSESRKWLWTKEGGIIVDNSDEADLLFSEDAAHEDTRPFYTTRAYKLEELTIYHPSYIEQFIAPDRRADIGLDRFILPSIELQKELAENGMFYAFENAHQNYLKDTIQKYEWEKKDYRPDM